MRLRPKSLILSLRSERAEPFRTAGGRATIFSHLPSYRLTTLSSPLPSPARAGDGCPAGAGRGEGHCLPRLRPRLRYFAPSGLRFRLCIPELARPLACERWQLNPIVFNDIVASNKLPFIFNNIVALMCSLLFLNGLVNTPARPPPPPPSCSRPLTPASYRPVVPLLAFDCFSPLTVPWSRSP